MRKRGVKAVSDTTAANGGVVAAVTGLFKSPPASPGDSYGAPGQGNSTGIAIITTVTLLFAWWLITYLEVVKPLFLPSPGQVIDRFLTTACFVIPEGDTECVGFSGATLWDHAWASLVRVFGSFFVAAALAIPIGIAMAVNRMARGMFDPPIEFYRPLPPLAYLPLTIIWFGIGEEQKWVLLVLAMFAPMALNARAGVRSVQIEQIHAAFSLGASRSQVLFHVILKGAMPEILTGMRIGIGFGWTTLVAAEMVAAQEGLGFMVLAAAEFLTTDVVVMGIVVIGVVAYSFDMLMRYLERKIVPWKGKA